MKEESAMEWLVNQVIHGVDLGEDYFRLILKEGYVELDVANGEVYIETQNPKE